MVNTGLESAQIYAGFAQVELFQITNLTIDVVDANTSIEGWPRVRAYESRSFALLDSLAIALTDDVLGPLIAKRLELATALKEESKSNDWWGKHRTNKLDEAR